MDPNSSPTRNATKGPTILSSDFRLSFNDDQSKTRKILNVCWMCCRFILSIGLASLATYFIWDFVSKGDQPDSTRVTFGFASYFLFINVLLLFTLRRVDEIRSIHLSEETKAVVITYSSGQVKQVPFDQIVNFQSKTYLNSPSKDDDELPKHIEYTDFLYMQTISARVKLSSIKADYSHTSNALNRELDQLTTINDLNNLHFRLLGTGTYQLRSNVPVLQDRPAYSQLLINSKTRSKHKLHCKIPGSSPYFIICIYASYLLTLFVAFVCNAIRGGIYHGFFTHKSFLISLPTVHFLLILLIYKFCLSKRIIFVEDDLKYSILNILLKRFLDLTVIHIPQISNIEVKVETNSGVRDLNEWNTNRSKIPPGKFQLLINYNEDVGIDSESIDVSEGELLYLLKRIKELYPSLCQ